MIKYSEFEGKTVLITAAFSGIGKATALKFDKNGEILCLMILMNVLNKRFKKSKTNIVKPFL